MPIRAKVESESRAQILEIAKQQKTKGKPKTVQDTQLPKGKRIYKIQIDRTDKFLLIFIRKKEICGIDNRSIKKPDRTIETSRRVQRHSIGI